MWKAIYLSCKVVLRDELINAKHFKQCLVHRKCYINIALTVIIMLLLVVLILIIIID